MSLTNARSSTAMVEDFEGLVKTANANEIRYKGARRVENLLPLAGGSLTSLSGWGLINSSVDGNDNNLQILPGGYAEERDLLIPNTASKVLCFSITLSSSTGGNLRIMVLENGPWHTTSLDVTLSATPTRYNITKTLIGGGSTGALFKLSNISGATISNIVVHNMQCEEVSGQTNQNPSEYLSDQVVYNSGIAGVKYFDYENGNTVDGSGVVIEADGAALTTPPTLLHEGAATNLQLHSEDLTDAAWVKFEMVASSDGVVAPTGNKATLLTPTNSATSHYILQDVNLVAGSDYIQSFIVKPAGYDFIQIAFSSGFNSALWVNVNISTGTVGNSSGGFDTSLIEVTQLSNGFLKVGIRATATVTTLGRLVIAVYDVDVASRLAGRALDGVSGVYMTSANMKQESYLTSDIPTTVAALSRAADVTSNPLVSGVNFKQDRGIALLRWVNGSDLAANTANGTLFNTKDSHGGLMYVNGGSSNIITYDQTKASSVIPTTTLNKELLSAVIWDENGKQFVVGLSEDLGLSWVWGPVVAYDGGFLSDAKINLFRDNPYKNNLKVAQIYYPNKEHTVKSMRSWVEINAQNLT